MSEISSAESEGSNVDGILPADTDIDQLPGTSSSVKGKNMYSFQLFFLFSLYPYILKVLSYISCCPFRLVFLL